MHVGNSNRFSSVYRTQKREGKTASQSLAQGSQRKVYEMMKDIDEDNASKLSILSMNNDNSKDEWKVNQNCKGKTVAFKIYTGTQCNVMSKSMYNSLINQRLTASSVKLVTYSGHSMTTVGKCQFPSIYKRRVRNLEFQVLDKEVQALLDLRSCQDLNLIQPIWSVHQSPIGTNSQLILDEYADVFEASDGWMASTTSQLI